MFDFFQTILDFFTNDVFDLLSSFTDYLLAKGEILFIDIKTWLMEFSWGIAKNVLETFDISGQMSSAINGIPSDAQQILFFFRIPECITNLLAGFAGRWVLKLIPGI